jgi:hypothetical protein
MREASCGSMMPAIIIYLFIHYSVSAAAVCVRYPAGHDIVVYLFICYVVPAAAACLRHSAAA